MSSKNITENIGLDLDKRYRWLILSLLFLTILIAFIGRLSTSVALEEIGSDLVWSDAEHGFLGGLLMGVFLIPYGFSNIFLSPNIDRYGSKITLTFALSGGSIAVFLGAFYGHNYTIFLISRMILGLSQGMMYPIATKVIAGWFEEKKRNKANSIFMIGAPFGIAIAPIIMGPVIRYTGWRASFYLVAMLGLLLIVPILLVINDTPSQKKRVVDKSKKEDSQKKHLLKDFKDLLFNDKFQQITFGFTAVNTVFWGTTLWLPSYLEHTTGFDISESAYLAAIPYVGAILGMLIGSWVSDLKGSSNGIILFSLLASGITILGLTVFPISGAYIALILLFFVFLFGQLAPPLFFTKLQNSTSNNKLGSATGLMNGIANTFGFVGPVSVGVIIALTDSYDLGLVFLSIIAFLGFLSFGKYLKKSENSI